MGEKDLNGTKRDFIHDKSVCMFLCVYLSICGCLDMYLLEKEQDHNK